MTQLERAKQFAREPLVHFLIGGALIFTWFAWVGEEADPASRVIEVTPEVQAQIALTHERTMQRPPTDAELDALIERYVREEVLYREALRLGLEAGDPVIRRRLAKKMDFLAASSAEAVEPGEDELEQWYAANSARYATDARLSFDQVYYADRPDTGLAAAIGEDWRTLGDPASLPRSVEGRSKADIAAQFGSAFAETLVERTPDTGWEGPIRSGVGWHFVRLRQIQAGEVPPLDTRRDKVLEDWRQDTRAQREDEAYQLLREAYTVEIDR